jgi:AP-1 complex subunit gamma-1
VPKYIQLRLEPASGASLPALGGAPVTQRIGLINTMHGAKPLAMKLRLVYSVEGQQVSELVDVGNLPAGL